MQIACSAHRKTNKRVAHLVSQLATFGLKLKQPNAVPRTSTYLEEGEPPSR
jgi:hypothetical protein